MDSTLSAPHSQPNPEPRRESPHIRWMIRRDQSEVNEIETASFGFPWQEEDFVRCLRQRNCIGMVAELNSRVVGYMIYELHRARLHVLNFAVHPDFRRRGIGAALIDKLKGKLSEQRRTRILLEVRETNLPAQFFFKSLGFQAITVLRSFYDQQDTAEDAYLMEFRHGSIAAQLQSPPKGRRLDDPRNRIAAYFED